MPLPLAASRGEFGPTSADDTYTLLGLDIIGQQQESAWSYFGYDGLGSVRQVYDSLGAVGYATSYAPYGTVFESYGDLTSSLGFTGEYTDPTGLLFLRARYLNTDLGMFLTKDPFEGVMDQVITRNAYIYAGANPVMYVDPSGLFFNLIIPLLIAIPILVAIISAAYDILIRQGLWRETRCVDLKSAGEAALAGALGAVEAEAGIFLGPLYSIGWVANVIDPYSGFTPRQFNSYFLSLFGLDDEYEQLINNLYFNAGSIAGGAATLVISTGTWDKILDKLQKGGGIANFTLELGNNGTLTLQLASLGVGEMTVIVTGAYGVTTSGQIVLMASNRGGGGGWRDYADEFYEDEDGPQVSRNNEVQNRQFDGAIREAERKLGRKLTVDELERVHNTITKENYSYQGIVDEVYDMFRKIE